MSMERTVVSTHTVADDLEIHVSRIEVDGVSAVDVRNYVPSEGVYGHGIVFPVSLLRQIRSGLGKAVL